MFVRCAALFIALVSAGVAADGPHFNITVPLQLTNLPPEVNSYRVACSVSQGMATMLGNGEARGSVSGGNLNQEVVVPITVSGAFADPSRADRYSCALHLEGLLDGRRVVFMSDAAVRFPLASGAPYTRRVEAMLP